MTIRRTTDIFPGCMSPRDVCALVGVADQTVYRWAGRYRLGTRVADPVRGHRVVLDDIDVVVCAALAQLTARGGVQRRNGPLELQHSVAAALVARPDRFVVATPDRGTTASTAAAAVAVLDDFDDPVVTVPDVHRAGPVVVAALDRLSTTA